MTLATIRHKTQIVQTFTKNLGAKVDLTMVLIPPGKFLMGSPLEELERLETEGPQHQVTIAYPFFMGQHPVTQDQWQQVSKMPQVNRHLKAKPARFKGTKLPVDNVSWLDAEEFCRRLSANTSHTYRLPSEAEWEYACRAGTTTSFSFGETIDTKLANYRGTNSKEFGWSGIYGRGVLGEYREKTTPVGTFPANNFGLYDMHGNVWEWCLDDWHESYADAPVDGSAWTNSTTEEKRLKILRGGSWDCDPLRCRSAFRGRDFTDDHSYYFSGFRVVYSPARILL
jgi:formylglycine-generating enzyme required for sulfatase activity